MGSLQLSRLTTFESTMLIAVRGRGAVLGAQCGVVGLVADTEAAAGSGTEAHDGKSGHPAAVEGFKAAVCEPAVHEVDSTYKDGGGAGAFDKSRTSSKSPEDGG